MLLIRRRENLSIPIAVGQLKGVETVPLVSSAFGTPSAVVHTWLKADKANFVKCASGTGRVKRATNVEGVVGPIRKLIEVEWGKLFSKI